MGWAQSNMMYDCAAGPPRPGSLLESVFVLVSKRRQEAEYFKTKALVTAAVVEKIEGGGKVLQEALDSYRGLLFPFLEGETKKQDKDTKKALEQWSKHTLRVRPLWRASDHKGMTSKLRKGASRVRLAESLRGNRKHRRI